MPLPNFTQQLPMGVRFLVSGGLATALHWGLMAMLLGAGVDASVATAAGAGLGAGSNYLLQFFLTFRSRACHTRAVPAYLATASVSWLANLVLFWLLHAGGNFSVPLSQGLTTLLVALLNFWLYKKVVFHGNPVVRDA